MARDAETQVQPVGAARAVRTALAAAALNAIQLPLSVTQVETVALPLDDMIGRIPQGALPLPLFRQGELIGYAVMSANLAAACVTWQTTGALLIDEDDGRALTPVDFALCRPVVAAMMDGLAASLAQTELEKWPPDQLVVGQAMGRQRRLLLDLPDSNYRCLTLQVRLEQDIEELVLDIVLPEQVAAADPAAPPAEDKAQTGSFAELAAGLPVTLHAQLCRFELPVKTALGLCVGQTLPLHGADIDRVAVLAIDGAKVANARLGQAAGMRAVRLQPAPPLSLTELPHQHASADQSRAVALAGGRSDQPREANAVS